jgi:hypothetical protein
MIHDIRLYNGITSQWQLDALSPFDNLHRDELLSRTRSMDFWVVFVFRGSLYYRTFEDHLYRVVVPATALEAITGP